jgi:hypothetical protein
MLLVAILAMLGNQGSLLGLERFAKHHHKTLNELLSTHLAESPSVSTFRLLLAQLDVGRFEVLLQQWIAAQPGVTEGESLFQKPRRGDRPEHLRHRCWRGDRSDTAAA